MEKVVIDGTEIFLTQPDDIPMTWVGQEELVTQVIAAWIVLEKDDLTESLAAGLKTDGQFHQG